MSEFKKIIPVILCVILVVVFHSIHKSNIEEPDTTPVDVVEVKSSEGMTYSLNADSLSYTLTGMGTCTDTAVVIHTYNDLPITHIAAHAFANNEELRSVTMTNVKDIANSAFENCTRLKSITFSNTLTSIGNDIFKKCTSLPTVTLPNTLVSCGDGIFDGCTNLSSVTLSDNMTHIGTSMFRNCQKLKSIEIPSGVTHIETEAFAGCTALANITLPDSIQDMACRVFNDTAYYQNEKNWENKALYIGNHLITVDTSLSGTFTIKEGTLTVSNDAFYACDHITVVEVPDSVTNIGEEAFYECKHLHTIQFPNSVVNIGREAFFECRHLSNIVLPESLTAIRSGTFQSCHDLQSVVIGQNVNSIDSGAFYDCWDLTYIFYMGTKEDWANIAIESYNDSLQTANIFYYSETQPTTKGNYWKLVGDVPVIWEV